MSPCLPRSAEWVYRPMHRIPNNISDQHRCIFIHVPKAAGTSIKHALGMTGAGHLPWHYYSICYPEQWRDCTSFAVVRNPWDRVVSAYQFSRMKESFWHGPQRGVHPDHDLLADKSFEECLTILCRERGCLRGEAWHEQTAWVASPKSLGQEIMVDRILRFENLGTEFPQLCRDLGLPPHALATINSSDRSGDYRQYYNDRSRELVAQLYASDIETFGYAF